MARKKAPEITFQAHIAEYLCREHGYIALEQTEITDTVHCIAEDHLWSFLKATQKKTLDKLTADYGADARDEIFKSLCAAAFLGLSLSEFSHLSMMCRYDPNTWKSTFNQYSDSVSGSD